MEWYRVYLTLFHKQEHPQPVMAAEAERQRALNRFGDGIELRAARQGWRVCGFGELDAPEAAVGIGMRQAALAAFALNLVSPVKFFLICQGTAGEIEHESAGSVVDSRKLTHFERYGCARPEP